MENINKQLDMDIFYNIRAGICRLERHSLQFVNCALVFFKKILDKQVSLC